MTLISSPNLLHSDTYLLHLCSSSWSPLSMLSLNSSTSHLFSYLFCLQSHCNFFLAPFDSDAHLLSSSYSLTDFLPFPIPLWCSSIPPPLSIAFPILLAYPPYTVTHLFHISTPKLHSFPLFLPTILLLNPSTSPPHGDDHLLRLPSPYHQSSALPLLSTIILISSASSLNSDAHILHFSAP